MKYALHPGWIRSIHDGDFHYIDVFRLAHLYKLKEEEWVVWDDNRPETYQGRRKEDYIHLYPRIRGDYERS